MYKFRSNYLCCVWRRRHNWERTAQDRCSRVNQNNFYPNVAPSVMDKRINSSIFWRKLAVKHAERIDWDDKLSLCYNFTPPSVDGFPQSLGASVSHELIAKTGEFPWLLKISLDIKEPRIISNISHRKIVTENEKGNVCRWMRNKRGESAQVLERSPSPRSRQTATDNEDWMIGIWWDWESVGESHLLPHASIERDSWKESLWRSPIESMRPIGVILQGTALPHTAKIIKVASGRARGLEDPSTSFLTRQTSPQPTSISAAAFHMKWKKERQLEMSGSSWHSRANNFLRTGTKRGTKERKEDEADDRKRTELLHFFLFKFFKFSFKCNFLKKVANNSEHLLVRSVSWNRREVCGQP